MLVRAVKWRQLLIGFLLTGSLCFSLPLFAQKGTYLTVEEFHHLAFPQQPLQWRTLWVTDQIRTQMETILQRSVKQLRIRYWGDGSKTAWIFEEIGKELPITVGVVVADNVISQVHIMEYRESRGGEVQYPFFTSQFVGVALESDQVALNQHIDGISGATLSVRALKKIATLALYCHQQTEYSEASRVE